MNFTLTPGFAASNWLPILLNASVSEVAANTTSVPVGLAAAALLEAAELAGAAAVLLEDELQAAASSATRANTTASRVRRRLRDAGPGRWPERPLNLRPSDLGCTPIASSLRE